MNSSDESEEERKSNESRKNLRPKCQNAITELLNFEENEKDKEIRKLRATIQNLKKENREIQDRHEDELEQKDDIIEDLKIKIKKLEKKPISQRKKFQSDSDTDEKSTSGKKQETIDDYKMKISNLEKQIIKQDKDLRTLQEESENQQNFLEKKYKDEIEEITSTEIQKLQMELDNLNQTLDEKDNRINELDRYIEGLVTEINTSRAEATSLDKELQKVKDQFKSITENDSYKNDARTRKQIKDQKVRIEELDGQIEELQSKLKHFETKKKNKDSKSLEQLQQFTDALNNINRITKQNFDNIDECIPYIKRLCEASERTKRQSSKDNVIGRHSEMLPDTQRLYDENDNLRDKIFDLESKYKALEKKNKKQVKEKDSEISELQEEIETARAKKPLDAKSKVRIKQLEEIIEDLEAEVETKNAEGKANNKKIKEANEKISELKGNVDEFTGKLKMRENDFNTLKEKLSKKEDSWAKKEEDSRRNALNLESIREQLHEKEILVDQLEANHAAVIVELKEYQDKYRNECRCTEALNTDIQEQANRLMIITTKIREYENEIRNLRIKKFHDQDVVGNGGEGRNTNYGDREDNEDYPNWWNEHKKQEIKAIVKCPVCHDGIMSSDIHKHMLNHAQ